MNSRLSPEQYFAEIALTTARRSTCPKAQVGAVLVMRGNAVAHGYNGAPRGLPHCDDVGCILDLNGKCIRVVHAEQNVLLKSGLTYGTHIYVTHTPCLACSNLIINAGIERVYYVYKYYDPNCNLYNVESQEDYLLAADVDVVYLGES
jgi:dCMP deaminase